MCIKNIPQNRGDVRPLRPILNRKKIEELLGEKFENFVMYYLDTNVPIPRINLQAFFSYF